MIQKQSGLFRRPQCLLGLQPPPLSPLYGSAHSTLFLIKTPAPEGQEVPLPAAQEARTQLSGMHSTRAQRKINDFTHRKIDKMAPKRQ